MLTRRRQGWVPNPKPPVKLHTHKRSKAKQKPPRPPNRKQPTWEDPEAATTSAMMQFVDPYEQDPDLGEPGRRWMAPEIRLKSNEDLQKLWVVLLKERNMLYTAKLLHKKRGTEMPHPIRLNHVRKSMAMIKVVLGERQVAKNLRDARLTAEGLQARALERLDMGKGLVWPQWIPGTDRELPLGRDITFNIVLHTKDKSPVGKDKPPPEAISLSLTDNGKEFSPQKLVSQIWLRPLAKRRPNELMYACHVHLMPDALNDATRFLGASDTELGPPLPAQLSASLYGEPLGTVPVLLLPTQAYIRRLKLRKINKDMSVVFKERFAMEDDPKYQPTA